MKYIRTKDGRIEMVAEQDHGRIASLYTLFEKEADTIEELVDVYVCVEPNGNHTILPSNSIIAFLGTIFYGAIWTDKGLIYVAKMNDKGELELL